MQHHIIDQLEKTVGKFKSGLLWICISKSPGSVLVSYRNYDLSKLEILKNDEKRFASNLKNSMEVLLRYVILAQTNPIYIVLMYCCNI